MSPTEEAALITSITEAIRELSQKDYEKLTKLIRQGKNPIDAVRQVLSESREKLAALFADALAEITESAVTPATVLNAQIGNITLSERLFANAAETSVIVEKIVREHARGFQDARELAKDLYEGYGFRPEETLVLNRSSDAIPRYLKELLADNAIKKDLNVAFSKAQAAALRTPALRAAYLELIRAVDETEAGPGADYLDKKLWVAFQEKQRYFATRIARTELHRAFAIKQAGELVADDAVEYVQWRLSGKHPVEDICDYFAGVDSWGLGPGVYPKMQAPVAPAHPHCMCVLSPRLDIRNANPVPDLGAQADYFSSLSAKEARLVAGGADNLERIRSGQLAWDVHNLGTPEQYQVKTVSQIVEL